MIFSWPGLGLILSLSKDGFDMFHCKKEGRARVDFLLIILAGGALYKSPSSIINYTKDAFVVAVFRVIVEVVTIQ